MKIHSGPSSYWCLTVLITAIWAPVPLYAEDWQPVSGADTLRELVSGATAEIALRPDVTAIGEYRADGTGTIQAWGEIFERNWEVSGDDTICYSSPTERNCYTFEQDAGNPGQYRARNVETGELISFRVIDTDAKRLRRDDPPDSEGGLAAPSAAEIAAELSNPNTNMGTMNFNFDYVDFSGDLPGASGQSAFRGTFQPSLPYALSPLTNLFVRPAFPVVFSQDVPNAAGGFDSKGVDLGDISFDALIARTLPASSTVVGIGVAGTLPTATNDALGRDQWLLGPEFVAAKVAGWGVLGAIVSHQWDVAGEDDFSTSITGGQYFYAFNLKDGWQINASPTFSYDHKASSDNAWTFPVGIGASKTMIINGRPWKFGAQFWHYVESPDIFGPDWQIRVNISPVVALPW